MLPRFVASWLVVLILAPFTAPFPTCDLATLVGRGPAKHAPIVPPASAAVSNDAAVVSVPAVFRAGRIRVLSAFRVSVLSNAIASASATSLRSVASLRDIRENAALTAVLRV
jgi:hypothetical protein